MEAIEQFKDAMRAHDLNPPEIIESDGKLHRFAANGKRGDDAGWYVFHDDGIPAGSFGDWRTGLSETWRANIGRELTPGEGAAHRARMGTMRRKREAEQVRRHAEARDRAQALWKAAKPALTDNPYLTRKAVAPVDTLREIPAGEAAEVLGYTPKSKGEPLTGRPAGGAGQSRRRTFRRWS